MAEPISASLTAAGLASAASAVTAASVPVISTTAAGFASAVAGTSALVIPGATATLLASVGSALAPLAAFGSIASTAMSLAGAGMRVAGGQQGVIAARQQAEALAFQGQQERMRQQQALLQAQSALLTGQTQSNQVRQALMRTLAAQNARYAGAGIALDEGTPASVAEDSERQAEIELGLIETNAKLAAADRRMQAGAFGLNSVEYSRRAGDGQRTAASAFGTSIFDAADRGWQRMPGWSTTSARNPAPELA